MKNVEKYINQSDTDLIDECRRGNEIAKTCLIKRYRHIIIYKAKRYAYKLNDLYVFIKECYIALDESIYTFKQIQQASYTTFIEICILRTLISYLRKQTTTKNNLLSKATPIDEQTSAINPLLKTTTQPPDELLLLKIASQQLKRCIYQCLTLQERKVIVLYLEEKSLHNISVKLNKTYKSVDNSLQRSIKKLKKCMD